MTSISLEIDGREIGIDKAWVHLQDPYRATSKQYRISIPISDAQRIFDPYITKGADTTWATHIANHVREIGTFILQGYIDNIKLILGVTGQSNWEWVLATMDDVRESDDAINIVGRAIPYNPHLY